ncbi:rhamnan synthesis F family protein [Alisedimentitalea sp. MJ-SS2]|uniref:rhamnan synthesis F family protein n=1 Tax=Aliisedimentitalea sp. MJ-SS2 TaxID=3049795 RepID=UPI00290B67B1|nr:rhamnan synthesis F family protein [Alisedimentitalea sp. MJ-SS2]MDU8928290.1 rhamnan synthesis F family protein [Alisedimentitalea sp. MJ-SS2]
MTKRLAILAQFDPRNGLPAHVRLHLEGLRPVVSRLVLVSNSPLDTASREIAEQLCDRVLVRENTGWDFAAWRDVLLTETLGEFDRIILTNSSVVGPLYPLAPIFEAMDARASDIWGMVMSRNKGLHLQSYFLSASAKVFLSEAWRKFWASVKDFGDKRQVIRRYEVGFSRAMIEAGFALSAMIKPLRFPENLRIVNIERLKGRLKVPFSVNHINRTVEFHEDLIRRGMPYLKASLINGKDTYRFVGMNRIKAIAGVSFPFDRLPRSAAPGVYNKSENGKV